MSWGRVCETAAVLKSSKDNLFTPSSVVPTSDFLSQRDRNGKDS